MLASGVRRSWLAHATSSRRASKRCSTLAAISLNDAREVCELSRAVLGRTCREVAARQLDDARRIRSIEFAIERVRTSAAPTAADADAAVTARIFTSSPMWNITQPEESHGGQREDDGERGQAGELEPHGRQRAERQRRGEPGRERGGGDDDCSTITAPTCSRRPQTVCRCVGCDGSSSIFSRSRRMWTVTVPVSSAAS